MKWVLLIVFAVILFTACDSGIKKSTTTYSDGKPLRISFVDTTDGKSDTVRIEEYWPNGNKRIAGSYKNNKREGEWTYWFENGNVWSKGYFMDGLSHGKFDIYKDDGSRYLQSSYKKGIPHGCWTFFDKNLKKKEVYFENDSIVKQIDY